MARLTGAMGIGRASLYATYGDKHALFLKALSTYARQTVSHLVARLDGAADPIEAIGGVLHEVAARASEPAGRAGCLITNTAAEIGGSDPEVAAVIDGALAEIEAGYRRALCRAQQRGLLAVDRDASSLAHLLVTTMHGLRVMGRGGRSAETLHAIADEATRSLVTDRRIA